MIRGQTPNRRTSRPPAALRSKLPQGCPVDPLDPRAAGGLTGQLLSNCVTLMADSRGRCVLLSVEDCPIGLRLPPELHLLGARSQLQLLLQLKISFRSWTGVCDRSLWSNEAVEFWLSCSDAFMASRGRKTQLCLAAVPQVSTRWRQTEP